MPNNTPAPADLVEADLGPWECFQDRSYYDMWCVRRVHDRTFGNGFHLVNGDEAGRLRDLLNETAHRRAAAGKDRELLHAILAAQNVQPYRGWNITALNKAVDAAREHLGLPSIRDLNPDIAAMQDAARKNGAAFEAVVRAAQPDPRDAEIERLREALAPFAKATAGNVSPVTDDSIAYAISGITIGDLRRARIALSQGDNAS